jgi:PAS domain S-box-containing protein
MSTPLNLLLLEDDCTDAELIVAEVERAGFAPRWQRVDDEAAYRAALASAPDVILQEAGLTIPFIVVSGSIGEERAVAMMQQGAADYLIKDRLGRLGAAVRRALEQHRLQAERARIEQALRANQALSHSVLSSLLAHAAVLDRAGQIIAVNPAWEHFARENGGDHRCGVGMNYLDVCRAAGGADAGTARAALVGIQAVLFGFEAEFFLEYPCHGPDVERWFQLHVFPLEGPTGGAVVLHTNVTRQKETEALLFQHEQDFTNLVENSPDIIARCDRDLRILYINRSIEHATGVPRQMIMGRRVPELGFPPELLNNWQTAMTRVLTTGAATTFDYDGESLIGPRHYHARVLPELSQHGEVVSVLAVSHDITEQHQAHARLQARLRQQAAIAALGQQALTLLTLDEVLTRAARVLTETLEVEFSTVLELLPDRAALLVRAGVGWPEGLIGTASVSAGPETHSGATLLADAPVVLDDLGDADRFPGSNLLRAHGVISGMGVVIPGETQPFGVLAVHTTCRRRFSDDDIYFLQSVAALLATAVQRARSEAALRMQAQLLDAVGQAVMATSLDGTIQYWNAAAEQLYGWRADEVIGKSIIEVTSAGYDRGAGPGDHGQQPERPQLDRRVRGAAAGRQHLPGAGDQRAGA